MKNEKALVVLSGGQDSVTCLALACKQHSEVHSVTFDYDQKHLREIHHAVDAAKHFGIPEERVNIINLRGYGHAVHSALTRPDKFDVLQTRFDLPATFTPARNLVFLSVAAGVARGLGIRHIYTGVSQTDYSGYPDCREDFIKSFQETVCLSMEFDFQIQTPLIHKSKAATFKLADELGCLDYVLQNTLTCYNGIEVQNTWGKGCGKCPACKIRMKGFEEYKNGR